MSRPDIDFAAVKTRHPIEDVFAKRFNCELERSGGGAFVTCCPFHDEKSPSCSINVKKQVFHCFGCGADGDVLHAVALFEHGDRKAIVKAVESLDGPEALNAPRTTPIKRAVTISFADDRAEALAEMPMPKLFRAEQLKEPPQHYFEIIARARALHWTSIKMTHDAGCLRFCQAQWKFEDRHTGEKRLGEKFNCYALLDAENPCNVQFRRMDCYPEDHPIEAQRGKALPFWYRKGKPVKVMGWYGQQTNWPVGIDTAIAHPKATILLVEGTGDFLAGWDIRALGHDVIPVALFGASNSIAQLALPFFERRNVIIVQQHDTACEIAAERWTQQLTQHHARVRTWLVPEEGADLNDYVSAGGDVNLLIQCQP